MPKWQHTRYSKIVKGNTLGMKIQVIFLWNSSLMLPPYLALYWGSECRQIKYGYRSEITHRILLKRWECLFWRFMLMKALRFSWYFTWNSSWIEYRECFAFLFLLIIYLLLLIIKVLTLHSWGSALYYFMRQLESIISKIVGETKLSQAFLAQNLLGLF